MFEKMRSDLSKRLGVLIDRFTDIETRAKSELDEIAFAIRAGVSAGENIPIFEEIRQKSREQGDLCGQAIQGLLMDRTLPLIFARSVTKAEKFAAQCEQYLYSIDLAKLAGKRAFRARMGIDE